MSIFKRLFSPAGESPKNAESSTDSTLEVEYCGPIASDCDCCGGVTITLNRLVKRDGLPYAMCRMTFSDTHVEPPAKGIFGIGMFGEGTSPEQRVAFAVVLRPEGVMVVDATEAEWPDMELLGSKLSREAALQHERKGELFHLIDELYLHDAALASHFARVVDGAA
jgi:hypothetical protein